MALEHKFVISANPEVLSVRPDDFQENLDKIRSKAAQLEAQLTTLSAEHAEIVEAAFFYQAAFAPWKQLPNEVLQRIFCWTKSTKIPTCVPFSKTVAPMQLTQVCSRWRAAAFATPAIWQDLKATLYLPPDKYDRQETIAFIQSWVARAAYMPLSILAVPFDLGPALLSPSPLPQIGSLVYQNYLRGSGGLAELQEAFQPWLLMGNKFNLIKDIILPNAPHIRDLHITFPTYYRHTVALLQKTVDFPLLEDLILDFDLPSTINPNLPIPSESPTYTLLKYAPHLRKVKFGTLHLTHHTQFLINWSHVTHFETGAISPTIFLQILGQMRSLHSCKAKIHTNQLPPPPMGWNAPAAPLNAFGGFSAPLQVASVIHIPTLHTLDLTANVFHALNGIDNLEFPNLKVFSLRSDGWSMFLTSLLGTIISLSELHIAFQMHPHLDALKNLLNNPAVSQLTHLSIRMASISLFGPDRDLFEEDTMKPIALGQLVPQLHDLQLEGRMHPQSLVHLLASKGFTSRDSIDGPTSIIYPDVGIGKEADRPSSGVVAPFQKVKIHGCPPHFVKDPTLEKIQELVGSDRFIMEASDKDQWKLMDQIDWEMDE